MMNNLDIFPLASFLFCAVISLVITLRRRWNPTALAFCAGMAFLALMEFANFLALRVSATEKVLLWKRLSLLGEVLFVGNCLLFSVLFAKEDIKAAVKKWKWALPLAYVLPGVLLVFLFSMDQSIVMEGSRIIKLGHVAKYFHVLLLIIVIAILMNLENTFRSSSGLERWRIKYMLFGLGSVLLFYVYILSQRLLYNAIDMNNIYIMSAAILTANILITYSIVRNKIVDGDIYISRKVIYSSISLIAIGLYSVIVALSAQILRSFNIRRDLRVDILLIFFAALAMIIVFYKESFRRRTKAIINRNFRKPKYVYHDEWMIFSTELSKKASTKEICEAFLKTLSERMFVKYTSLWLIDEDLKRLYMIDSQNLEKSSLRISMLNDRVIEHLYDKNHPISKLDILANKDLLPIGGEMLVFFDETKAELLVPLILAQRWVGLLTLGKIETGEIYDEIEDYDLLKSAAAHAASAIDNARLFEEKMRTNELEAFHRLSSFIIHDLKNTTSMLSMVTQNAKKHFHNPEFQKDALQTISQAVARMKKMMGSLSDLPDRLELQLRDVDLNELIIDAVEKVFDGGGDLKIERQLAQLPRIRADAEEIYKVLHNLLLNACEALDGSGRVQVSTHANGDEVVFSVSDNGPGMSREFMENSLFKQFKSTKRKGLGIGLYQCKTIVEAHNGRIEAESEPGKGSIFSVCLPIR